MGAGCDTWLEGQLSTGVWTDLTSDTQAANGLRLKYGIDGNRPLNCVAGTGELNTVLQNWATAAGRPQGYYSPLHASKRSGWTFGIPVQSVWAHGSDVAIAVSSITRSGSTATVTTASNHGRSTGDYMRHAGAAQAEYNGTFQITVAGLNTYTFTVAGTPATPATGTITARRAYVKHRGKIRVIDPDAGQYRSQLVRFTSYDGMRDLFEADLRSVTLQQNKTESELVAAILDALPAESRPIARDLDTGVDSFPIALDDLEGGVKAAGVIQDVTLSAFALAFMRGDGTFTLQNRHTRATGSSHFTFNNTMHGLSVPAALDNVYNVVRVTIRPRTISAAATEELYTLPTGTTIEIPAGQTLEVWTDYTDPNDRQVPVGGLDVVEALVGGTHYSANSAADGSGTNLTASITADIDPFSSTAKWTLTNGAAVTAYIRVLKAIGKAVRDLAPQTYEASSTQPYGNRPLNIDLRYQNSGNTAQSYAEFLEAQYNSLANQLGHIEFIANDSSDFMRQALEREPGDIITVTETVTGVSTDAVIHHVEFDVTPGPWVVVRWLLAPAAPFQGWVAGITGRSEAGVSTVPGF